jgi:hypothetical protein
MEVRLSREVDCGVDDELTMQRVLSNLQILQHRDLYDKNDRHGLARTAFTALAKLNKNANQQMWVGYDQAGSNSQDRKCSATEGATANFDIPRASFTLFSRAVEDVNIDQ